MALKRRDARLSARRAAERALCRCDRLLALGHVLEIVGHRLGVVLVAVAGRIIDVPVPRAAVLHIDVAVVLVDVRLDALILFELVTNLVPSRSSCLIPSHHIFLVLPAQATGTVQHRAFPARHPLI